MLNINEVIETNRMIHEMNLDVRTITMGISLLDCIDTDLSRLCDKIHDKIVTKAKNLVKTGKEIETEYGIPIVNKRISVTPIAMIGGAACKGPEDFVEIARTLDAAALEVGVNFIGGYSALVNKGMTKADEDLIRSIPKALACALLLLHEPPILYRVFVLPPIRNDSLMSLDFQCSKSPNGIGSIRSWACMLSAINKKVIKVIYMKELA